MLDADLEGRGSSGWQQEVTRARFVPGTRSGTELLTRDGAGSEVLAKMVFWHWSEPAT